MANVTESLNKTSEIAGNVTAKMSVVVQAVEGQTDDIEQVTLGIDQISEAIQVTSATSKESAGISQELASQSQQLKKLAGKFYLN